MNIALGGELPLEARLARALAVVADGFAARTCTLHRADRDERRLELRAHLGLPEHVVPIVEVVPFGKGMAGLCAERLEPVSTCNLQIDDSGIARPRARETGVAGALVVPVLRHGRLAATLGVGKPRDHSYTAEETRLLQACGEEIVRALDGSPYQQ